MRQAARPAARSGRPRLQVGLFSGVVSSLPGCAGLAALPSLPAEVEPALALPCILGGDDRGKGWGISATCYLHTGSMGGVGVGDLHL